MKTNVNIYSFGYWGYGGDARGLNRRLQTFNQKTRDRGLFWVDLRIRRSVRRRYRSNQPPYWSLSKP